ncbi:phospholipid phosphatase 1-like [Cylas formicarius]|uniref:phospholipid phosphatase 1-like n=1 Tax=Cylas formicarius TaxID=197179 RepID=UPI002958BE8F|nr:phospholipid phosphatase 1-like [Cylas formicarius]
MMTENGELLVEKAPVDASLDESRNRNQNEQNSFSNRSRSANIKEILVNRVPFPLIIDAILVLTVLIIFLVLHEDLVMYPQVKVGFYCQDPALSKSHNSSTIAVKHLMVSTFVLIPVFTIAVTEFFKNVSWKQKIRNFCYLYTVSVTTAMMLFIINKFTKFMFSEHRPDFFAVCRPDTNENCTAGTYVESFVCLNKDKFPRIVANEISKSFPSTHATLSVFVTIYCSYIVQGVPSSKTGFLVKHLFSVALFMWSIANSVTRITDGRHFWWDVVVGVLLGAFAAWYVLRTTSLKIMERVYCGKQCETIRKMY